MGKFFRALKKSEVGKRQTPRYTRPKEAAKISPGEIQALKVDTSTTPHEGPAKVSSLTEGKMDHRLALFLESGSVASECFKLLRAKILIGNPESRPRSIMVSSPQPLDGKTTVAVNLAISIALGINEYVLLVDCDLRRPSINTVFGIDACHGISEYLEEGTSVAPYLISTPFKKLTMLPSGTPPSNPSELLSSKKMRLLVQELESRYNDRFLIFDATPAQFAAEATFLANMVDGVLLVVRAGMTSQKDVLKSIENLGREKILGVVFNASTGGFEGYNYYYRHYGKDRT